MSYTAMRAGTYTVSATMRRGTHIDCGLGAAEKCSSFVVEVEPGPTSHETTEVSGPGLADAVAGVVSSFGIQARDAYGNDRRVGGDAFDVRLALHARPPRRRGGEGGLNDDSQPPRFAGHQETENGSQLPHTR